MTASDPAPATSGQRETWGATLIAAERRRQVEQEGWTPEHDAEHGGFTLVEAGRAYMLGDPASWPWHSSWWKPKNRFRDLLRAGALFQAAIDVDPEAHGVRFAARLRDDCARQLDELRTEVLSAAAAVSGGQPTDGERLREEIRDAIVHAPAGQKADAVLALPAVARLLAAEEAVQRVREAMDGIAYLAERSGTGAEADALDDALGLLRRALDGAR